MGFNKKTDEEKMLMGKMFKKTMSVIISICIAISCIPTTYAYAKEPDEIAQIIDNMSLRQKITQCMMVDFRKWSDGDMTVLNDEVAGLLADYQFGSVILFAENIKETDETVTLTRAMQNATMSKGGIPLLIATDQEGGIVYRLGSGTALPGNMALAATGDSENAKKAGQIIGRELDSVGINTTLAPVIDVNNNANNPIIGLRSFSDNPDIVGEYGSKYISGLAEYNIIGCAKHFPGHGDVDTDSHTGLPVVNKSKETIMENELKPYKIAIAQGIDMIMTAHILYPQLDNTELEADQPGVEGSKEKRPATLSYKILTEMLRGELGFNGVVITDAINMDGVHKFFSEELTTLEALKAGADMICMPVTGITNKTEWITKTESIISYVENAVDKHEITEDRIDQSVRRILTLKQKKGILSYDATKYTTAKALATVGSQENRSLEREISAKAVTVIRNDNNTLPIKTTKNSKILMLAAYGDEEAQMVMGLNRARVAQLVSDQAEVDAYHYSKTDYEVEGELKKKIDWADTVIVESEVGNASAMGYRTWASLAPKNVTEYCKKQGKKSVVMSVSKPYDIQMYPDADAIVAAYGLKGSNLDVAKVIADKITDSKKAFGPNIVAGVEVIFGVFGASGKLPVNVPVFDAETGKYTDKIAYKRGYGITYDKLSPEDTKEVPEETIKVGSVVETKNNGKVKVLRVATEKKAGTVAYLSAPNKASVTVPATVKLEGKNYSVVQINAKAFKGKKITTVTIGANVSRIESGAFKGSKVKKLILKTKKLATSKVKGSLKSSSVKLILVKTGDKQKNKQYVKKYKKVFAKKNSGKEVVIK